MHPPDGTRLIPCANEAARCRALDPRLAVVSLWQRHSPTAHWRKEVRKETEAAVEAFRFNAERFPDSANAHDSLGEALAKAGRIEEAVASYRRALGLDPRLSSSRVALDRLDAER